jgi:co-chaperonin GroES (HSP10)
MNQHDPRKDAMTDTLDATCPTFTLRPEVFPLGTADELAAESPEPRQPIAFLPRGRRVLVDLCDVRQAEAADRRIFVDATVDGAIEYGVVRAVGPQVDDPEIRAGTVVMFGKFSGYGIEGEKAMVLREDDVMMVVRGGEVRLRSVRDARAAEEVRRATAYGSAGVAESARIVPAGADWRDQAVRLEQASRAVTGARPKAKRRKGRG